MSLIEINKFFNFHVKMNTQYYRDQDLFDELYKVLDNLKKESSRNIVVSISLKGHESKTYEHFFVATSWEIPNSKKIQLQLFPNFEQALIADTLGHCLNMNFYKYRNGTKEAYIDWISGYLPCNFNNRSGELFISLSEQLNILFKVNVSRLSDEALFSCYDPEEHMNKKLGLSLSYIFKYGKTFYNRKSGYRLNYPDYEERGEMTHLVTSTEWLENYYNNFKDKDINTFEIPSNISFYENATIAEKVNELKSSSRTIGSFLSNILTSKDKDLGCNMYDKLLKEMHKNNQELRTLVLVLEDTSGLYYKSY